MAESTVRIEGVTSISGTVTSTPSGTQAVSGTVLTMPTSAAGTNFYTTQIADILGVVAANNFISVFNPIGSGKTITFYSVVVVPWATAATTVTNSMSLFRTTAASAGTLLAASSVAKFSTASPNSVAEVRTGNPTVTTTGIAVGGFPPAVTSAGAGVGGTVNVSPPSAAGFMCLPGEGLVLKTTAGDVDQLWNLGFIWSEV